MTDRTDPLRVEWGEPIDGLDLVRQSPPVGSPSFSASYVGPAGWGFDPAGGEGSALMVSQLVTSGAGKLDRVELARVLDRYGATISRHCAPESTQIRIWGPASEWERLLGLLADVVLRPRLDPSDITRVRRQVFERQLRELTQPASRAERELLRSIFPPGHPYRESGLGTRRSVSRISRSDLVRFHRTHYTPEGAAMIVTTPVPIDQLRREVRSRFQDWAHSRGPVRASLPVRRNPSPAVRTIPMAGRSQVEVRIGGVSGSRSSERYSALFLANEVLGGRPMLSRLFQHVRERQGLAYHASSEVEAMRWGGYWIAGAGTGAERTRRVVELVRNEVDRIREETIPQGELDRIRTSAIGEIPLSLETTAGAHELAVDVAYYHLPGDFYRRWPSVLRALSPSQIRRAVEEGMDGRQAVTILAGPSEVPTVPPR